MAGERHAATLMDRIDERSVLDRLLSAVGKGESRVLVLHGQAGVGKTVLLRYLAEQAAGCHVVRVVGVESEMELAFSGLHQLCVPVLDYLAGLPLPQQEALRVAFGISAGPPPDRFLVGLALLSLLSVAAEERPLLVIVDDAQWLDQSSAQALGFVAQRLAADPVGLVFAGRELGQELADLPRLEVGGLRDGDARALLDAALTGPVDAEVRERFIAEAQGNPLALLELPRGLTAGGFELPEAVPVVGRIEESFRRQIGALPADAQRMLVVAAADPSGDPVLVRRAAERLGIGAESESLAGDAGLVEFGARVWFRHPLVRSAAYRAVSAAERWQVHAALAEATDPEADPDRRAWHRAQAASGPDEEVAAELEASAGLARARGGLAAAAALLERAAMLTADPAKYAERALAAAEAKLLAGAFDAARELLAMAEATPLSELERAQADLVRARLAFVTNRGRDAPPLLLDVARRLDPIDAELSGATYLDAITAAMYAGRLSVPGGGMREVARAIAARSRPDEPRVSDLMLDGLVALCGEGHLAGVPIAQRALAAVGSGTLANDELRLLFAGCIMAMDLWDDDHLEELSARAVRLARAAGALADLLPALSARNVTFLLTGELAGAASLAGEMQAVIEATGSSFPPYSALGLAAWRGSHGDAAALVEASSRDRDFRGQGDWIAFAEWSNAVLNNGLGRYQQALGAAQRHAAHQRDPGSAWFILAELVEAGVRSGMDDAAAGALGRLAEVTAACGTDWGHGVEARSSALMSQGKAAEDCYRESIERLARTRARPDLGRAHLLFGEWLRRERRRAEARQQLRTAHDMLETMGMAGFARRAARELQATGEVARKRTEVTSDRQLTAQELQVARLARDGLSNPEIGARLFISARTVQYHLSKVFTKLDIVSRGELRVALPGDLADSQA